MLVVVRNSFQDLKFNYVNRIFSGVCDSINCGPNGVCIEVPTLQSLFYLCECTNGTGKYTILGPCLGVIPTTTTTTTVATTPRPLDCQNGGK